MFHTNPWTQNYHKGVTQKQLQDIYDYKKYIVDDNQINRKYTLLNKDNNSNEQQRITEIHIPSSSITEEQGRGQ
jgi:hypothetical protein